MTYVYCTRCVHGVSHVFLCFSVYSVIVPSFAFIADPAIMLKIMDPLSLRPTFFPLWVLPSFTVSQFQSADISYTIRQFNPDKVNHWAVTSNHSLCRVARVFRVASCVSLCDVFFSNVNVQIGATLNVRGRWHSRRISYRFYSLSRHDRAQER